MASSTSTAGAVHQCDLIPGSHTWVAVELCESSSVTIDYCGTDLVVGRASDRLILDCPCSDETGAANIELCPNGNPRMTWDCLPPGIYYYPVLAQSGSEEIFSIEITSDICSNACDSGTGDCCAEGVRTGCGDSSCCETVCQVDPYCCDTLWDGVCAKTATLLCSTCPGDPCLNAPGDCLTAHDTRGCNDRQICEAICQCDPHCCSGEWDEYCAGAGFSSACGASLDCNENGVIDVFEIISEASTDCNGNWIPDECEADCNGNGIEDACDIKTCVSGDCNENAIPDECDVADGPSPDCNANASPDECDAGDANGDGLVTVSDWAVLPACLSGPCGDGGCSPPRYEDACCTVVDSDGDGDVDLLDVAEHQTRTTAAP